MKNGKNGIKHWDKMSRKKILELEPSFPVSHTMQGIEVWLNVKS